MAPQSWETFGGRGDYQPGSNPTESLLLSWALQKGFVPMQAQAKLCVDQIYAPCYRQRMLLAHDFRAGLCCTYNQEREKAGKVCPLRIWLNPMHLLMQQAYLADKVCSSGRFASCWADTGLLVLKADLVQGVPSHKGIVQSGTPGFVSTSS